MDETPTSPPANAEDYGAFDADAGLITPVGVGPAQMDGAIPLDEARRRKAERLKAERLKAERPDAKSRLAPIPFKNIMLGTSAVYLVKDLIPREGLVVVWGPPKCGKSFWTFDLVMHPALGWEYRGRKVKKGAVIYVACEGQQGFRARIEAFRQRHLSEEAADVPFYLIPASLDLIAEHADLVVAIQAELGSTKPAAVVLDTLNRSIQGDENSSEDMTAYIRAAGAIQAAFGCVVIVVHHCGVEGKRPRGHTSLTGACDVQIAVKREVSGAIVATLEWAKDGPEGDEICSRLEAMEVGVDEDGEPIISCVIVPADKGAVAPQHIKLTDQAKIALDHLKKAVEEAGEPPPASNHIGGQNRVVPLSLWRGYCQSGGLSEGDNEETFKKAWKRSKDRLLSIGIIKIWDGLAWIVSNEGDKGTRGGQVGDMSPDS